MVTMVILEGIPWNQRRCEAMLFGLGCINMVDYFEHPYELLLLREFSEEQIRKVIPDFVKFSKKTVDLKTDSTARTIYTGCCGKDP